MFSQPLPIPIEEGSLARVDIAPIEFPGIVKNQNPNQFTDFSPEFKRWLANFVDNFNDDMSLIEAAFMALPAEIFTWQVVMTASDTLVSNNGYISDRPSLIMYTLPVTSSVGDIIRICEANASGTFMISQNAGQSIQFGNVSTSVGVAGSITSTAVGDSIEMVCTVADLNWLVLSVVGNLIPA